MDMSVRSAREGDQRVFVGEGVVVGEEREEMIWAARRDSALVVVVGAGIGVGEAETREERARVRRVPRREGVGETSCEVRGLEAVSVLLDNADSCGWSSMVSGSAPALVESAAEAVDSPEPREREPLSRWLSVIESFIVVLWLWRPIVTAPSLSVLVELLRLNTKGVGNASESIG